MVDWMFARHYINDVEQLKAFSPDVMGFVYEVTLSNGMKYIGKKNLFSVRKKKFGKKKLAEITDKRLKKYEMIIKESDWKSYYGSSKRLKEEVAGGLQVINREILALATSKMNLTYLETKHMFVREVLERSDEYYNDNILGKFYKKTI